MTPPPPREQNTKTEKPGGGGAGPHLYILLGLIILCFFPLRQRWLLEQNHRRIDVCVDLAELKEKAQQENLSLKFVLMELRACGVTSVGLYERSYPWGGDRRKDEPPKWGFDPSDVKLLKELELRPILRLENHPYSLTVLQSLDQVFPLGWDLLPAGLEVPGYPLLGETILPVLKKSRPRLFYTEFVKQKGLATLAQKCPEHVVSAHAIEKEELKEFGSLSGIVKRWRRAVRERGCRLLYVRLMLWQSMAQNVAYVKELTTKLRQDGFILGQAEPLAEFPSKDSWIALRKSMAFWAAVVWPCWGLWLWKSVLGSHPQAEFLWTLKGFLLISIWNLAGALAVGAALSDPLFMSRVHVFSGVKSALFLPVLAAVPLLLGWRETQGHLKHPVLWEQVILLAVALGAAVVVAVRSGNTEFFQKIPGESFLRRFLEDVLLVRPRTKEFLIGHPLLLSGLFVWGLKRKWPAAFLIAGGMIGQTSLINTFCHAHTPLSISFLRTVYGIGLGFLFGLILIPVVKFTVHSAKCKVDNPKPSQI